MRRLAAAAAWAAFASTPALAQSSDSPASAASAAPDSADSGVTRLSTIVVTPARSAEPLAEALGDNSVVDRAELDTIPNATLAEALGRQHAVEFVNYGGPQTVSTINMRGTNSNQSLVLIDGLRINNATTGLPPLNAIPLNSVERIEIVRGTGASLYGADAIGGVINVITRSDQDRPFSAYANAGVGSYASTQYDAGFSGASDGWVYSLYGGYGQSAGYNSTTPSNYYYNPDQDSYYRSNVGGQLGYTWKPGQTLTFQTFQSRVNGEPRAFQPHRRPAALQHAPKPVHLAERSEILADAARDAGRGAPGPERGREPLRQRLPAARIRQLPADQSLHQLGVRDLPRQLGPAVAAGQRA